MALPIVSAIVAHKFVAALLVASLVTSGGAVAVSTNSHISNVVGELSFIIKPSQTNVTQLASLNLGTLVAGETGTDSSTAIVNVTSTGTYGMALENTAILHEVFGVFNVTITGFGGSTIVLSLVHPTQSVTISSTGLDTLGVSVLYAVSSGPTISRGITVSNAPFLELINGIPTPIPQTSSSTAQSTSSS